SGSAYVLLNKIILPRVFAGRKFDPKDQVYLASKILSTIHGSAVAIDSIRRVLIEKTWDKDTVNPYPRSLDYYFSGHLGYTLFELVLFLIRKESPSLWLHHLVDAVGSSAMLFYRY